MLVLGTYVYAGNGEMLGFSFFPNNRLNSIFHSRGFEPCGVVSWPQGQGAVFNPPKNYDAFCDIYGREILFVVSFYIRVKAKLTFYLLLFGTIP